MPISCPNSYQFIEKEEQDSNFPFLNFILQTVIPAIFYNLKFLPTIYFCLYVLCYFRRLPFSFSGPTFIGWFACFLPLFSIYFRSIYCYLNSFQNIFFSFPPLLRTPCLILFSVLIFISNTLWSNLQHELAFSKPFHFSSSRNEFILLSPFMSPKFFVELQNLFADFEFIEKDLIFPNLVENIAYFYFPILHLDWNWCSLILSFILWES